MKLLIVLAFFLGLSGCAASLPKGCLIFPQGQPVYCRAGVAGDIVGPVSVGMLCQWHEPDQWFLVSPNGEKTMTFVGGNCFTVITE